MGRTWFDYDSCYYGYAIKHKRIFDNTPFAIDKFYKNAIHEYEGYIVGNKKMGKKNFYDNHNLVKYDCSSLMLLEEEFEEYIAKYHPDFELSNNTSSIFITCDEYIGVDNTYGHPDSVMIVLGYELHADMFQSKKSDVTGMNINSLDLYFPDNIEDIFIDFLARFYLKHCAKAESIDEEMISKTKNELGLNLEQGIFANLVYL